MDQSNMHEKITGLFKIFNTLDARVEKIGKKIKEINSIYMKNEFNKNLQLNQPNSYLKFQVDLLANEKKYYLQMKSIFQNKFTKDLYKIYENIILLLVSIESLDFGFNDDKKNIMKKIIKCPPINNNNFNKILHLTTVIFNNLEQTRLLITLFEKFILDTEEENINNNIHSNNFKLNLMNKKSHLTLEYSKYTEQLDLLISYFTDIGVSIKSQLKKQELLKFFVSTKKDLKLKNNNDE